METRTIKTPVLHTMSMQYHMFYFADGSLSPSKVQSTMCVEEMLTGRSPGGDCSLQPGPGTTLTSD